MDWLNDAFSRYEAAHDTSRLIKDSAEAVLQQLWEEILKVLTRQN